MAINQTFDLTCFTIRNKDFRLWGEQIPILNKSSQFDENKLQVIVPRPEANIDNEIVALTGDPLLTNFVKQCLILNPN